MVTINGVSVNTYGVELLDRVISTSKVNSTIDWADGGTTGVLLRQ